MRRSCTRAEADFPSSRHSLHALTSIGSPSCNHPPHSWNHLTPPPPKKSDTNRNSSSHFLWKQIPFVFPVSPILNAPPWFFQNMCEHVTFPGTPSFLFRSGNDRRVAPATVLAQDERLIGGLHFRLAPPHLRFGLVSELSPTLALRLLPLSPLCSTPDGPICMRCAWDRWNNSRGGEATFGEWQAAVEGSQMMTRGFLTPLVASPPVWWYRRQSAIVIVLSDTSGTLR